MCRILPFGIYYAMSLVEIYNNEELIQITNFLQLQVHKLFWQFFKAQITLVCITVT